MLRLNAKHTGNPEMTERNRNLDELNDWLQVVATIGVIASIIFLGLELRQNSDLMKAQIYQSRAEAIQETFLTNQESEYIVPILVKMEQAYTNGATVPEAVALLTAGEEMRIGFFMKRQIRHLDNMYYQHALGLIDEEYMTWWKRIIAGNVEEWYEVLGENIDGRQSFVDEVRRIHTSLE
jgi:hypothetical protein